jgi:hypothetical protein
MSAAPAAAPEKKKVARITNWAEYDRALERRGRQPVELVLKSIEAGWQSTHRSGLRGRPEVYAPGWILAVLLVQAATGMPLRQTVGYVKGLLEASGQDGVRVPSRATLSRRRQEIGESAALQHAALFLKSSLDHVRREGGEGVTVLVDSTGLTIRGPGSWRGDKPVTVEVKDESGAVVSRKTEKPRRTYLKLHVAICAESQAVLAVALSEAGTSDASVLPSLLEAIPAEVPIRRVVADGAYDAHQVYAACHRRGVEEVLVPPSSRAAPWPESGAAALPYARLRNTHFEQGDRHKSYVAGGRAWKLALGYHVRSLVETTMSRLWALCRNRLFGRSELGRHGEALLALDLLNLQLGFGRPVRESRAWA